MKRLMIIGAGGHGKVILDIALEMRKWEEIYFLDDTKVGEKVNNHMVIDSIDNYKIYGVEGNDFFVAIGNNSIRKDIIEKLIEDGLNLVKLIHPFSSISNYSKIGRGTAIMSGVVINTNVDVGDGVIINTSATIDHDCKIGNYVHISPGVNIGGTTLVGEKTWLCIGASVINNIIIGENVIVAAGGVVINNISKNLLVGGVPTKELRQT